MLNHIKITEYYSDNRTRRVEVVLLRPENIPRLFFFENEEIVDIEDFNSNTLQYAEDAAENWCLGIKKLPYETK